MDQVTIVMHSGVAGCADLDFGDWGILALLERVLDRRNVDSRRDRGCEDRRRASEHFDRLGSSLAVVLGVDVLAEVDVPKHVAFVDVRQQLHHPTHVVPRVGALDWAGGIDRAGRQAAVSHFVVLQCHSDLHQVVLARSSTSRFSSLLDGGQ